MRQKIFILSSVAALVMGVNSAMAATPVTLTKQSMTMLKKEFSLHAGLKASSITTNSLNVVGSHKDFKQVTHKRLQQMYQGVPVIGGYAITHGKEVKGLFANNSNVTGKVYHGLSDDLGGKPNQNTLDKALSQEVSKYVDSQITEKKAELVVYVDKENKAHWAAKVSFVSEDFKSIPKKPSSILDAKTLKPFVSWNDIKSARHDSEGIGFGGNSKTGEYQFGKTFPKLNITRDDNKKTCYMENTDTKVVDMNHRYSSNNAPMSFSCTDQIGYNTYWTHGESSDDGYDKINGAFSPTNDALYDGFVIKHMYRDWYGLEALEHSDGSPMKLVMRVHYGSSYENAFWDGKQMTFGDGGSWFHPLVSLGVGAHEISHGFTEQHANLQYWGQSGGMNESFSDMAAQAAEYYSEGHSSWMIGNDIVKDSVDLEALRFMDRPSKDSRSIDTSDDYYDGLDVHFSSGVYNRLFYLMATTDGWNAHKAFDVMVKANQDYWTPYTSFDEGACGVISAAADLDYSIGEVKAALDTVKVKYDSCGN